MFPPNLDPQIYSISAVIVGAAIAPELNAAEANTVGNWIVLVGDYLLAYAGQITLIESRKKKQNQTNSQAQMDAILKALRQMECEIEKLKKEYHL